VGEENQILIADPDAPLGIKWGPLDALWVGTEAPTDPAFELWADTDESWPYIAGSVPPGGTTGQVLGKTSSLDFDVEWVDQTGGGGTITDVVWDGPSAPADPTVEVWLDTDEVAIPAIPATVVDAKGDLLVASAADTVVRLPVGTNGQVLVADSTAPNGVRWATLAAGAVVLSPHGEPMFRF
jgi:hypothetical protein